MMSRSSGFALYTVATPENVVPKSTATTSLSSTSGSPSMEGGRVPVLLIIVGTLLCLVALRLGEFTVMAGRNTVKQRSVWTWSWWRSQAKSDRRVS